MEVLNLCFIGLSTVFFLWFLKPSKTKAKRLPPGPWTLPFIGSLHHLLGGLPHRRLLELSRNHGPVMFLMLGEVPNVVVSTAEVAELVMKTHDLIFATRPRSTTFDILSCGGKGIVFAPYGDHWRQMRKICMMELLSLKQVKRMESVRTEEVANLLGSIASSPVANISKLMAVLGNDLIMRAVFGGKCAQKMEYLTEHRKLIELIGGFCPVDLFPSSRLVRCLSSGVRATRRSYDINQRIIVEIIEGRKAQGKADGADEDFLDVLLRLQEEDSMVFPLTSETIGAVIFDIIAGASDSTSITLSWAMSELLRNPNAMAKAQLEIRKVLGQGRAIIKNTDTGDLHYLKMVIKEVLRLHPPGPLLAPREARKDCEIMGYNIPKGTKLHVNVLAITMDPRYWKDPEDFKPERFENNNVDYKGTNFEFTPFGAGRRMCPGIFFATSTVEVALANLLYHFNWVLPYGAMPKTLDMSEKFGMIVSRRYDLKLRAIPSG